MAWGNFGTPTTSLLPATPLLPLTVTPKRFFCLRDVTPSKSLLATCIEHATVLRANIMQVTAESIKQVKACLAIHD